MSKTIETEIAIAPDRWSYMFTLLTLDVIFELREHIELRLDDPDSRIRSLLRRVWQQHAIGRAEGIRPDNIWTISAADALEREIGHGAVTEAQRWCTQVCWPAFYDTRRYGHWTTILLQACFGNLSFREALRIPSSHVDELWKRVAVTYDDSVFGERVDQWTFTDWDSKIRFSRFIRGDDSVDALSLLLPAFARIARERQFWTWLCNVLSDADLTAFHDSAKQLTRDERSLAFIDALAHPRTLAIDDHPEAVND